jgi:hypothetical protein
VHVKLPFHQLLFNTVGAMLSIRGRKYATLDLAEGYTKVRGNLYDKVKHPDGLVSLTMAENVRILS